MKYYLPLLIICVICILLFHLILIKWLPRSKRFWKKVDYWWVSMGFIGIIGAAFSFRKEHSIIQQPWHKQVIEAVYNQFENSINSEYRLFSDSTGFDYSLFQDRKQAARYIATGFFYKSLVDKASQYRNKILLEDEYDYIDSLIIPFQKFSNSNIDLYILQSTKYSGFMLSRMKSESNVIIELKDNSQRNTLEWVLLVFSPFLVAIAIAIRLTKVTAELKEIPKDVKGLSPPPAIANHVSPN